MIRIPEDGILYHGSYIEVSKIDLGLCREGLDFGKGFYLTSSFEQALSYVPASVKKAKRRGILPETFQNKNGKASVFQFIPTPNLSVYCFADADKEWLHFTACNRNRNLFPELREKFSKVDIIGGKVADDLTAVTLNNYVSGTYGEPGSETADRIAIELLEPERLKDQFCFRTEAAIQQLRFIRSERYDKSFK